MRGALVLACLLAMASATAFADEVPAAEAQGVPVSATDYPNHKRTDPGLGVWVLSEAHQFEGLLGAVAASGGGIGYSFDLVSINLEALQSLGIVGERRPTFAKLDLRWTFFTLGNLAGVGQTALDMMFNGPDHQTDLSHGPDIGPELGLGLRYRISGRVDLLLGGEADVLTPASLPRRAYFNPGVSGGVAFYPFGGS